MGLTCWSHRHHCARSLWCLLLVVLEWQNLSLVRAILSEGGGFQRDHVGGRFDEGGQAQVVGDLEISTRVEEVVGRVHSQLPDASLPHGREVRVQFSAFGEKFDVFLFPLRRGGGDGSRVRAFDAKGNVLVDRTPRLCTYEGHLPQGGWVRAVIRSPTSATVHFLHNGELHSLEPAFSRQSAAIPVASTTDHESWSETPGPRGARGLQAFARSNNAADTPTRVNRGGAPPPPLERPGLGSKDSDRHRRPPGEEPVSHTHKLVHVAYRHSDLISARLQQQAVWGVGVGGEVSSPSALLSAAAEEPRGRAIPEGAERYAGRVPSLRAQTNVRDAEQAANEREEQEGAALDTAPQEHADGRDGHSGRQRSLLASEEAFRMSAAVGNGVGWGWDRGPFGAWPECPSSPRVFQIGIAMDTGFFKASTGFGADQAGNVYGGEPDMTLEEAIDLAESEVQGIVSLVNVLYTDQLRLYIELKSLEIRTEIWQEPTKEEEQEDEEGESGERLNPLEARWNHEPLDHTRSGGRNRLDYGCPYSRKDGVDFKPMSPSSDHHDTLKGFAAWRESLPPEERLGIWQLLTACYGEGVQGLSYEAAACSDNMGVGWASRRPLATWEVLARELGHSLGASDFLDETKDLMRPTGGWNSFAMERAESRKEVCTGILSNEDCFQSYEPTCGNGVLEPGEECDDESPCCSPAECKLVPNARCSRGPSWWRTSRSGVGGEGSMGQCCSDDCQFLSSATLCEVPGGETGVCANGGCRRTHKPRFGSYETCVNPEASGFNPCVEHYRPIDEPSSSSSSSAATSIDGISQDAASVDTRPPSPGEDEAMDIQDSSGFRFPSDQYGECMEESKHPLPVGTVCDHDIYKECSVGSTCVDATPPQAAVKRINNGHDGDKRPISTVDDDGGEGDDGGEDARAYGHGDDDDSDDDDSYDDDDNDDEDSSSSDGDEDGGDGGDEGGGAVESGGGQKNGEVHGDEWWAGGEMNDAEQAGADGAKSGDAGEKSEAVFSVVYQGCFRDGTVLKSLRGDTHLFREELSAFKCGAWCADRGHSVMGLQNGRRCSCGDSFGGSRFPRLPEVECSIACTGDGTQRCGAFGVNSIYSIVYHTQPQGGQGPTGEPSPLVHGHSGGVAGGAWGEDDSASGGQPGLGAEAGNRIRWPWDERRKRSVPVYYHDAAAVGMKRGDEWHVQDAAEKEGEGGGEEDEEEDEESERGHTLEYVGCFRDHPGGLREFSGERSGAEDMRDEAVYDGIDDGMEIQRRQQGEAEDGGFVYVFPESLTLNVCKMRCMAVGMPYFGVQFGRECRCGDRAPSHDPAANCVSPCTGDRTSVCGGAWANTVYRIRGLAAGGTGTLVAAVDPTAAPTLAAPTPAASQDPLAPGDEENVPDHPSECWPPFGSMGMAPSRCAELLGEERAQGFGRGDATTTAAMDDRGEEEEEEEDEDDGFEDEGDGVSPTAAGPSDRRRGRRRLLAAGRPNRADGEGQPRRSSISSLALSAVSGGGSGGNSGGADRGAVVEKVGPPEEAAAAARGRRRRRSTLQGGRVGGSVEGDEWVQVGDGDHAGLTGAGGGAPAGEDGREEGQEAIVGNSNLTALPIEVLRPLEGESLTPGTVATVTWAALPVWDELDVDVADGLDLWLVEAAGEVGGELIGNGIGANCRAYQGEICAHSFAVPSPRQPKGGTEGETFGLLAFMLELRVSEPSKAVGRSSIFSIVEKTAFTFTVPNGVSVAVRGTLTDISWQSAGNTMHVWIDLHDADTGGVAAPVGAAPNTGSLAWVVPRRVPEGEYYFVIRPLTGQRRFEKTEASEVFRVADPSMAAMPPLALLSPARGEHVAVGAEFPVSWTSPDIDRVRITLQNEWEWEAETLLFEGVNWNAFLWQVPSVPPGAGYYLQLEDADEPHGGWQGQPIVGGVGQTEFDMIGRGVRTGVFTIAPAQPEVSLGNMFQGQTGHVWTKGVALAVEVENAARDEEGEPLPVVLELMQRGRPVWTVPGSPAPAAGSSRSLAATMPQYEPADGLYYLRATSVLHHQAFDVSPEFAVTSYLPMEWAGLSSSLELETSWQDGSFEPGKSYYVSWTTTFVGWVTVELTRAVDTLAEGGDVVKLSPRRPKTRSPNKGGFWLTVPFGDELGADWCPGWQDMASSSQHGNGATTPTTTSGDSTSAAATSSTKVDAAVELDGCCFVLSVADAQNTGIGDRSAPFCIAGTAAPSSSEEGPGSDEALPGNDVGGGGGGGGGGSVGGSSGDSGATLEVTKFPSDRWEIGTVEEIQWASEGVHSPVAINLLGPETDSDEAADGTGTGNGSNGEPVFAVDPTVGDADEGDEDGTTPVTTPSRRGLRTAIQLGSGLPAAGSFMAPLGPRMGTRMKDVPPGIGYMIEVRDSAGNTTAVSAPFEVVAPPSVSVTKAAFNATPNKGDACRVEWDYTGIPSTVRVQLVQGSPTPVTLGGVECIPFKTRRGGGRGGGDGKREVWESGCVQDPTSPLYRQCAIEVDRRSRPTRTGYCAKLTDNMKVVWQSDEIPTTARAAEVTIPRDELGLPSVGPSYFWKVTSASDPQAHGEGETFSLRYPSTLLSFRTSGGASGNVTEGAAAEVLVGAVERSLLLKPGELELFSIDPDPFRNHADTNSDSSRSTPSPPPQERDNGAIDSSSASDDAAADDDEGDNDNFENNPESYDDDDGYNDDGDLDDDDGYNDDDGHDDDGGDDSVDSGPGGRRRHHRQLARPPPAAPVPLAADTHGRTARQAALRTAGRELSQEEQRPGELSGEEEDALGGGSADSLPDEMSDEMRETYEAEIRQAAAAVSEEEDGDHDTPLQVTFKMAGATTPWDERSPKQVMQLLGFLCESDLLSEELGDVDCSSITLRDESASDGGHQDSYESIIGRRRPESEGLSASLDLEIGIPVIMVGLLAVTALVVRKRKRSRRQGAYFSRGGKNSTNNKPGVRYYRQVGHADNSDVLSVEGEDAYGKVGSPGSFTGAVDSDDDTGFGANHGGANRGGRHHGRGFREAASNIVAKVLSGGVDRPPPSPRQQA